MTVGVEVLVAEEKSNGEGASQIEVKIVDKVLSESIVAHKMRENHKVSYHFKKVSQLVSIE